jgi:hypothetical protein
MLPRALEQPEGFLSIQTASSAIGVICTIFLSVEIFQWLNGSTFRTALPFDKLTIGTGERYAVIVFKVAGNCGLVKYPMAQWTFRLVAFGMNTSNALRPVSGRLIEVNIELCNR